MTRVLVLGGGGMLGHKLCQLLPAQGFEVTATLRRRPPDSGLTSAVYAGVQVREGVDVLDSRGLEQTLGELRPEVLINCVGIVKQLPEAEDRFLSMAINSLLPHQLHRWCAENNSRLIHISTDCVFDGVRGQYRETDDSNARDVYGKSKFLGETDDREPAAVTLRTSIIGRELGAGHGLVEWFLAQQGKSVKGFRRAIFTGFTTHELANVITRVIRHNPTLRGLYQVASPPIDKFELLGLLRDAFGLQVDIQPDEEFVCDRSLLMDRFAEATGYRAPAWREMIARLAADPTPYR